MDHAKLVEIMRRTRAIVDAAMSGKAGLGDDVKTEEKEYLKAVQATQMTGIVMQILLNEEAAKQEEPYICPACMAQMTKRCTTCGREVAVNVRPTGLMGILMGGCPAEVQETSTPVEQAREPTEGGEQAPKQETPVVVEQASARETPVTASIEVNLDGAAVAELGKDRAIELMTQVTRMLGENLGTLIRTDPSSIAKLLEDNPNIREILENSGLAPKENPQSETR